MESEVFPVVKPDMMKRFEVCNRCGKAESYPDRPIHDVTCNITKLFWEHDTRRCLCEDCERKLKKLMDKRLRPLVQLGTIIKH